MKNDIAGGAVKTAMREPGQDQRKGMARYGPWRQAGRYMPLAVILLGLFIAYMFGLQRYLSLDTLSQHHDRLLALVGDRPVLAASLFFVVYTLAVGFSFPAASVLTVFAGFLFGWAIGGMLVVLAATAGASIVFLAARTAFGDILKQRASAYIDRFAEGFRADAFNYLLILRLAPIFPFFVVNIAPAFFAVRLRTFVLATLIGIIPGTFAYAWLGSGLESAIADAAATGQPLSLSDFATGKVTLAFALLALVAAVPLAVRKFRHQPQEKPDPENGDGR